MKLEGGKISTLQFFFLVTGFTLSASIIYSLGQEAKQNIWLAYLAGLSLALFFAFIFLTLAKRFPGKTLIEINNEIYGSYLGKLISLGYLWYFLHLGSFVLRDFGNFFQGILMPETPLSVFVISMTLISASAARNGIEVISRCGLILIPLTILTLFATTLLLFPQMKFTNFLPIMDIPLKDFVKASYAITTFPFGDTVTFLMVLAFINNKQLKSSKKIFFLALISAGLFIAMIGARNTAVLGIARPFTTYPTFTAVRLINLGDVFTRVEVISVFALLSTGFIKLAILHHVTTLGIAQLLNLRTYLPLILPIGIIMISLCLTEFKSSLENLIWTNTIYPFYAIPFQIGIPLLSLLIAIIRKLPKENKN